MAYVIGIDTGGTYTDAVLLETQKEEHSSIVKKSKAFTSHDRLEIGIAESIEKLKLGEVKDSISKVVLSTTLATNAIVEKQLHNVGVLVVGDMPPGQIATDYVEQVPGKINIKGRTLVNVNHKSTVEALNKLLPHVGAIAISGAASVRNPMQEIEVKEIVQSVCDLPVMCGHEFVTELGFLERTNTVTINAGLLPIINRFLSAIRNVLEEMRIDAPIFVVKGDGSIATEGLIKEKPIETALSGPAASMIGTIHLTGLDNAIVSDMGGTTTDTGIVANRRVQIATEGAEVGEWRIKVKSAKMNTFGLGGDSRIVYEDGEFKVGPRRVLPACRGGGDNVTPTDLVHYSGEFIQWDKELAANSIRRCASAVGLSEEEFVSGAELAVIRKIHSEIVSRYEDSGVPICAIGAPADTWYEKLKSKHDFNLVIPTNYEVANAVGAATAGIQEVIKTIVRPGEEGHGYLIHAGKQRAVATDKWEAIKEAYRISQEFVKEKILRQNLELDQVEAECIDVYMDDGDLVYENIDLSNIENLNVEEDTHAGLYVETRIQVSANGKNFI